MVISLTNRPTLLTISKQKHSHIFHFRENREFSYFLKLENKHLKIHSTKRETYITWEEKNLSTQFPRKDRTKFD